jgi:hypothetical protein
VRVALTVAALVVLAAALIRQTSPGASARPAEGRRPSPPPRAEFTPGLVAPPARDVFRYTGSGDAETAASARGASVGAELVAPPALSPPPSAPKGPRLIGLLRRGGVLLAALWVDGETLVVGEGGSAGGYTVVAVDDEGVTLRDAAGSTVTLSTPEG